MAVAIVQHGASSTVGQPSDTATVTLSSTPSSGNLLVAGVGYFVAGVAPPITPAGWTELNKYEPTDAGIVTYYKVAGGSESTSYAFTTTGSDYMAAAMYEVSGQHASAPFTPSVVNANNSGTSHTTGSITPTTLSCLALTFLSPDEGAISGSDVATVSAGWTINRRVFTDFHPMYAASRNALTTDTTTAINTTFSSLAGGGPNSSVIMLIAPAAAAATTSPGYIGGGYF